MRTKKPNDPVGRKGKEREMAELRGINNPELKNALKEVFKDQETQFNKKLRALRVGVVGTLILIVMLTILVVTYIPWVNQNLIHANLRETNNTLNFHYRTIYGSDNPKQVGLVDEVEELKKQFTEIALTTPVTESEKLPTVNPEPIVVTITQTVYITITVTPEPECVYQEKVLMPRYIFTSSVPIPVGEVVEVIPICKNMAEMALKWEQRIGNGLKVQYFAFPGGVQIYKEGGSNLAPGEKVVVSQYHDTLDALGNRAEDGVVDAVTVASFVTWSKGEMDLIEFGRQFYQELVEKNLIYLKFVSDIPPDKYLVDGQEALVGPYGYTYQVKPEGSWVTALWEDGATRWQRWVKPGQGIVGTDDPIIIEMNEEDPNRFCQRITGSMYPTWQPDWSANDMGDARTQCPGIHSRWDKSPEAVMARLGFYKAEINEPLLGEWVPYIFVGGRVLQVPPFESEYVKNIQLEGATLEVKVNSPGALNKPELYFFLKEGQQKTSAIDIQGRSSAIVAFVRGGTFSWDNCLIFETFITWENKVAVKRINIFYP